MDRWWTTITQPTKNCSLTDEYNGMRIKDERTRNKSLLLFFKMKEEKNMSKVINGKKYMLVDVVVIGDLIYDIYEDEQGNRIKLYSDYVR